MYKKIISILLLFMLVINVGYCSTEIAGNDIYKPEEGDGHIFDVFPYKNEIISLVNGNVFVKYNKSIDKFEPFALFNPDSKDTNSDIYRYLLMDHDKLYAFSHKSIHELSIEKDKVNKKLIYENNDISEKDYQYYQVVNGSFAYCINWDNASESMGMSTLNIETGEKKFYKYDSINSIGAYKDSVYMMNQKYEIFKFEDGEFKKLYDAVEKNEVGKLLYDNNTDTFYFLQQNGVVSRLNSDGKLEDCALISPNSNASYIDDNSNLIAINPYAKELLITDLKTAKMPDKVLRISGLMDSSYVREYNKIHTDMPAVISDSYFSADKVADIMKSNKKPDLIFMELDQGVTNLIRHDYIEEITDKSILEKLERMYPYVKRAIDTEGKYYIAPYNVYSYGYPMDIPTYVYNKQEWSALGLTENDIPKTFAEFIKFIDRFQKEFANSGVDIFSGYRDINIRAELKMRLLNEVIINAERNNEVPSFNTPQLQELFDMIDKAEFTGFYDPKENHMDGQFVQETDEDRVLIKKTEDVIDIPNGYAPMPLSLFEGTQALTGANMTVMFVNSLSENKQEAFEFLNMVLNNLKKRAQTYLYKDVNETVLNPDFVKSIKYTEQSIEKLKKDIEEDKKQGGKNVKQIEENIKMLESDNEYFKKNSYLINQEELDNINNNSDNIVIRKTSPISFDNEQINKLLMALDTSNGQIMSSKQFLTELDRIVKMSHLEEN